MYDDANPGVVACRVFEKRAGVIAAAVIHEDDLVGSALYAVQDRQQSPEQLRQDFLFVEDGDADRQPHDFLRP